MSNPHPCLNYIPREILCAADYERLAPQFIAPAHHAYIAGGSGDELTMAANRAAFNQTLILPRLLSDLRAGHTRLELFGRTWLHPILLAPVAYQGLAHPGGELETARAGATTDSGLVLSTLSNQTLEEVAQMAGAERWFQLYCQPTRTATVDLIKRAEMAGYRALVVTLDSAIKTPSRRAQRAGFALPVALVEANLVGYAPVPPMTVEAGASRIFLGAMQTASTWEDLTWLLGQTRLPVLVKGVLHADDAQRLQALGVAGLIVSNHGGRSLDGVPASLTVLPAIRQAVGRDYPLLLDSGVRSGSDIFKALALGANAVLIGRLQVYALAVAGALGVAHLLRSLREELEVCMAQAGCATLADIDPDMIHRQKDEAKPC